MADLAAQRKKISGLIYKHSHLKNLRKKCIPFRILSRCTPEALPGNPELPGGGIYPGIVLCLQPALPKTDQRRRKQNYVTIWWKMKP